MNAYSVFRDDLLGFCRFVWPGYQVSAHHVALTRALQRVSEGKCKRLIITMPPQKGKSLTASQLFPAWCMGKNPNQRIILTAFASEVAERYSRAARDIVRSDRYKAVFPEAVVDPDLAGVGQWRIHKSHGGYVRAIGITGGITSFGAEILLVDDPYASMEDAMSEATRASVWSNYQSVIVPRLSVNASIIVIHTRWMEDDLAGRLLREQPGMWEHLNFPAIEDPVYETQEDGQEHLVGGKPLWPEEWSLQRYAETRLEVGRRVWEAEYQGNPVPDTGGIMKREYFFVSPSEPPDLNWIRVWDLAVSSKTSACRTVGIKIAQDAMKNIWVSDVQKGHWEWPEARRRIMQMANLDGPQVSVYAERPAYGGKIAGIDLVRDLLDTWERTDIPFRFVDPIGDLVVALNGVSARGEAKRLALVRGAWNEEFIEEVCAVPLGKLDDQAAALCLGFRQIAGAPMGRLSEMLPPRPGTYAYFKALHGEDIYDEDEDEEASDPRAVFSGI